MAAHVRKQIREAIAGAITGLTTTSTRVFQSRVHKLEATDLPCLLVQTQSETVTAIEMTCPRKLERVLTVEVVAVAKGVADVDDTLDQISKEVEVALAMPVSALSGLAQGTDLTGVEIEMDGGSEQPVGKATLRYQVLYYTEENAPDVAI
jgi:hypothetical protein